MARDAIAFLAAMQFSRVDLLGFSIDSFVAQQIALIRPTVVRSLVLACSGPQTTAHIAEPKEPARTAKAYERHLWYLSTSNGTMHPWR